MKKLQPQEGDGRLRNNFKGVINLSRSRFHSRIPINMKKYLIASLALFYSSAAFAVNFQYYPDWTLSDKLYYSTFNEGEKWKWHWSLDKPKEDTLTPAEKINLCLNYGGMWSHYEDDCVFEEDTYILDYIEALEAGEPVHYSAPNKEVDIDPRNIDPATLDWAEFENWSPEIQLYFSTVNEQEKEGILKPWSFK